ncbi:MAG: c-type cytochrome [Pseudomonadota bacterium]
MNTITKTVLATVGIGLVLGVLAALAFIYSGVFNVAATVKDARPLYWMLVATREASIKRHARDIQAPAPGGAARVDNGFRIFREECVMCHTPPGRPPTMMAEGLNPQAPALTELVEDMSDAELFWVTKHGIRFTGMPAWRPSRSDQEIWDLVAFMRTSPDMKAADYDALDRRLPPQPSGQR